MKIKVYLNDWFYNAGIVGFLRILEANDDEFAIKRNNYIEFDTESLRKFHKYYFKYFFQKYNVAENVENRTKNSFDYLENNIEVILENKDKEKAYEISRRHLTRYTENIASIRESYKEYFTGV